MLWSKHNINKFFSGTLLIVLLFVHSVKLLHSHPQFYATKSDNTSSFEQVKKNSEIKLATDCEICNYQVTKDTDNAFSFIEHNCKIETASFYNEFILGSPKIFYSTSESRGPPSA